MKANSEKIEFTKFGEKPSITVALKMNSMVTKE